MNINKNNFLIALGLFFALFSCVKEPKIPPTAEFSYEHPSCTIPLTVEFKNLSVNASVYRWDFGDGSPISHEENPIHNYTSEGVYDVKLISYGAGGMGEKILRVYAVTTPVVTFYANDTLVVTGDTVFFTSNLNSTLPSAYLWSFGDGFTSSLQNSYHVYSYPGVYTVVLTVTNACGSSDMLKQDYIKVVNENISTVFIKKIILEDMPFPQMLPRNPYYKITTQDNTLLKDGRSEALYGISQYNMPVFWDLNPYFQIPTIGNWYKIQIWDAKTLPPNDIFVGEVVFNMGNYTSPPNAYPPTITLTQNQIKITLDLQWQ